MGRVAGSRNGREPYWRLVLARWKRSGLSVRAFCLAEGVSAPSFYWWRRELQRATSPSPRFFLCMCSPTRRSRPPGASRSCWPMDAACGSGPGSTSDPRASR
ncbi:IS66 family insertion sequence element accessory protein TnpA [Singulisphaera sp. Ch08]|uniref:IS66 family insertion sequence element accessory protein TnpA n=1 Tax=Singulisphaera sp. Ch08 TaxID=3120278 RepID=UPI0038733F8C